MEAIKRFFKRDQFAAYCGIELLDVREGYARVKMEIKDHHLNGIGIVHGGVLFTVADLAFAAASNSHGTVAVSINAHISNVKSSSAGTIYAEARETSLSHKIATYTVEIKNDGGDLLAIFEGMVYRKKDPIDLSNV